MTSSPQPQRGGYISLDDARHASTQALAAAAAADPRLVPETDIPAIARRLDSVDEELMLAEMSLYELVKQLEPVLPVGFGQDAVPPREPRDVDGPSPLAARLGDLAGRAHSLVNQLKIIVAAVDL